MISESLSTVFFVMAPLSVLRSAYHWHSSPSGMALDRGSGCILGMLSWLHTRGLRLTKSPNSKCIPASRAPTHMLKPPDYSLISALIPHTEALLSDPVAKGRHYLLNRRLRRLHSIDPPGPGVRICLDDPGPSDPEMFSGMELST